MLTQHSQVSFYTELYTRIPEDNTLRIIQDHLDFSFINNLLKNSYSLYYGRPSKEPEMMVKLLILKKFYGHSDESVIQNANLNLAYMYFLGINPEDPLPHPSLLTKFRRHRAPENLLDNILQEITRQGVEMGIVKGDGLTIDSTHIEANTTQHTPETVMRRLAKKIQGALKEELEFIPEEINEEIPNVWEIQDHREAKQIMKSYLEELMVQVENGVDMCAIPETKSMVDFAKEILEDPKFLQSKGTKSVIDPEARVGHKSRTHRFFGYKAEFTMTTPENMITAVHVDQGSYADGTAFEELLSRTKASGVTIDKLLGDKAYFRKEILEKIKEIGATPYIPVSEMVYRVDQRFRYNKDSDEWFCDQGNKTVDKVHKTKKNGQEALKYYFEMETCRHCPLRQECAGKDRVRKILEVGLNAPVYYEHKQRQETKEFKEIYKERAAQERKNGEMKNFHGLDRAEGYGLRSVSSQTKLTAIAVNLKRIAKIISST